MDKDLGKNISFDIFNANGTSFHGLVLHKATYDSVVMSLGDKIVGDAYYKDSSLNVTCKEYIVYNNVHFELVNPPTVVREGMASDNTDLHGMTKYSFEFYHPMYKLSNMPFTDIAVRSDQERFLSQNKTFSWIGTMEDYVAKLNANLKETEWVVRLSDSLYVEGEPTAEITTLGDVLSFDNNTIADALKTGFDTYGISFVIDKLDATDEDYAKGKRFLILFGLPSNEIIDKDDEGNVVVDELNNPIPFVFKFGQGVGLKNNSRNPKNNKIVTRIAGYGSTNNIPYGYPQIRWWGDQSWTNTKNDATDPLAYPIYEGIVGGEYVKLIKHPFTREHLMPSVYTESVFNKVSPYLERELPNGEITPNPNYNPQIEIIDYYDAIASEEYPYKNEINPISPSYEIHEFGDIKPELGAARIVGATPLSDELEEIDTWEYTMDDNGEYHPSYFKIQLPILSFDIYACASITEEMHINMRGGACVGCTFPIQVDWEDYKANFYDSDGNFAPYGEQRNYTKYPDSRIEKIEVIVQKEYSTFGTLMPNQYQYPKGETSVGANDGDLFVILGISLPLSYITSAEERLDVAMKAYMLENNDHYFDYPLKFDEYFLRTHLYILEQVKPNTKVRFLYNDEELQLFVKQLTIKFGNTPLPQYDITLTDDIDVVLNQIGQVVENVGKISSIVSLLRQNFSEAGLSIGQVRTLIDTYGSERFISRVRDDVANGVVTFLNGLWVKAKNLFGIDKEGNATLNDVDAKGVVGVGEKPTDSLIDGSGTIIDDGRVQTTDMEVRGSLKVLDLIASQIHSLDGYYYFSDSMKIARVVDTTPDDSDETTRTARLYFEKQYDNDFLKFYQADILLSASVNLNATPTTSEGGNVRQVAAQSWMAVTNTSTIVDDELWVDVVILDDSSMPQAGAYVARRGNENTADESLAKRRDSWCISVEEGRLVYYVNQSDTTIDDNNYGIAIGRLPDITPIRKAGLVGEIGVYAKYLLAQHMVTISYAGDTQYVTIDEGEWDATTAANQSADEPVYLYNSEVVGNTTIITRVKVTHNGCEWLCKANDLGKNYTAQEPALGDYWTLISGDRITAEEFYYATTATDSIDDDTDGEGLSLGSNDVTWYADQSLCEYDALFPYMWKKTITKTVANPTGTQTIELIGVYGETGLNCHVTTDKDNIFLSTNHSGKLDEETTEEVGVHLWLDTEEIQIGAIEQGGSAITIINAEELEEEGFEVNVYSSGNSYFLEINIPSTIVFDTSTPKPIEMRVNGKTVIANKEYCYTRIHTINLIGVAKGENTTTYEITANADVRHKRSNGTYDPTYISFAFKKHNGESVEDVALTSSNAVVQIDGASPTGPGNNQFQPTQYVTIRWVGGQKVFAEKTVRVVSDGTAGGDSLSIELSQENILLPVQNDTIPSQGSVRVDYRVILNGVVQTSTDITLSSAEVAYHGSHTGYLNVTNGTQYFTVGYGGTHNQMASTDWAEIRLTFSNGWVRTMPVYPNVAERIVIGSDALNVRMTPETWQIPIYDPKIKDLDSGNWKPIVTRSVANLTASIQAMLGKNAVEVEIYQAAVEYFGTGRGYITATISQDKQRVELSVNEGVSVEATDSAKVNITYKYGTTTYSGLSISISPILSEAEVTWSNAITSSFNVGSRGGLLSITPGVLSFVFYRKASDVMQVLDTSAKRALYCDTTKDNYIAINSISGGTEYIALSGLPYSTMSMETYKETIDSVDVIYTPIDGSPQTAHAPISRNGANGDRGYPGCLTRLHVNVLKSEFTYRNDSLIDTTDANIEDGEMFYVDYIAVEDTEHFDSGYDVYVVTTQQYEVTFHGADIDLRSYEDPQKRRNFMALNGFQNVNTSVPSAWFTTLFAKNANIRMMDGANIHMTNDNNEIVAGMSNASSDGFHFWSGAATGGAANFSVDTNGNLKAKNATLENATVSGKVTANMLYSPIIAVNGDYNIGTNYANGIFGRTYLLQSSSTAYTVTLPPVAEYAGLELQFFNDVHRFQTNVGHYTLKTPDADNPDYIRLYNNRRSFEMPFWKMVVLKANTVYAGHGYWEVISGLDTHSVFMQYGNVAMAQIIDMNTSITQTQGIDLYKGTDIVVDGKTNSDKILYLPTSADVRNIFGLGSNDPFAYKIRITISYGSQGYTYIRFPSNDQTTNCKYFIGYNGSMAYDTNLRLMIGDVLEIMHVNDGTYVYAQILNLNT